jgi:AcrR family transcriptional regulator
MAMARAESGLELAKAKTPAVTREAERSRRNILEIATEEFASKGFSGARIDEIAARTNTSKRMIYYYFTDKEGLFVAVLEAAYGRIRGIENALDLDHLPPDDALAALAGVTFDYHTANPDFVRLVMVENIHDGAHLKKSRVIHEVNVTVIDAIRRLYQRGVAAGRFREGLDPIDIHMSISALAFHNVSNRSTFSLIFEHDMSSPRALAKRRAIVVDTMLRYVRA